MSGSEEQSGGEGESDLYKKVSQHHLAMDVGAAKEVMWLIPTRAENTTNLFHQRKGGIPPLTRSMKV